MELTSIINVEYTKTMYENSFPNAVLVRMSISASAAKLASFRRGVSHALNYYLLAQQT